MSQSERGSGSVFRIAVATDIHLGFGEKDPIRGNDSFKSFEECLKRTKEKNVDFLLLGGDLFHENKPSRQTVNRCITLLRRYCLGDRPVAFEFLSDPSVNFGELEFPSVNYEDFNLNVGLPVFSINGNHDDLTGNPPLCALDMLHNCGLLNYFGKFTSVEKLVVTPLLLRKGDTNLAIFGMGAVRDERLHQMFEQGLVIFNRPKDDPTQERWFNLLVIHQNRVKRGDANYIPESFIPNFFDLVIWGHEHPCEIDPMPSADKSFFIMQPGSTVATQLAEGEEGDKCMGILVIERTNFKLDAKIKLETVRQFHLEDINLAASKIKPNTKDTNRHVEMFLKSKIDAILDTCKDERLPTQPEEPLIRLRVDHSGGFESFNALRFGMKYHGKVANPREMILWSRKKEKTEKIHLDREVLRNVLHKRDDDDDAAIIVRPTDYVKEYFEKVTDDNKLLVLSEGGLGEAIKEYVDKDEKDAIEELTKHQMKKSRETLKMEEDEEGDEDVVVKQLKKLRVDREKRMKEGGDKELDESVDFLRGKRVDKPKPKDKFSDEDISDDEIVPIGKAAKPPVMNGKANEKRGAAASKIVVEEVRISTSDDDDDEFDVSKVKPQVAKRGRGGVGSRGGRGRGRAALNGSASTSKATSNGTGRGRGRPRKNPLPTTLGANVIPESPVERGSGGFFGKMKRKKVVSSDEDLEEEKSESDDEDFAPKKKKR